MSDVVPDLPTLTPEETAHVLAEIERWRGNLEDELGTFTTEVLPTGRVLLLPKEELPHVCYMSDDGPFARLCVDDYVPEIANQELDQSRPSDDQ